MTSSLSSVHFFLVLPRTALLGIKKAVGFGWLPVLVELFMKSFIVFLCVALLAVGALVVLTSNRPDDVAGIGSQSVSKGGGQAGDSGMSKIDRELASFESYPFNFSATTISGKRLSKADYLGRVLIVDIWATWCPPCRAEIPSFVELQSNYEDKGLSIVGFNFENASTEEQSVAAIDKFRRTQPINYPLILGDDSITDQVPNFRGFPTTLFIDSKGKVRMTLVGAHPLPILEAYATRLLSEIDTPMPSPVNGDQPSQPKSNPYVVSEGV
jgi:thiol-disulfide isomerase/thioredoxin